MRKKKIELWQGRNMDWYFHVVAANGEIVSPSQGYTRKWSAKRAARSQHPGLEIRELVVAPWQ